MKPDRFPRSLWGNVKRAAGSGRRPAIPYIIYSVRVSLPRSPLSLLPAPRQHPLAHLPRPPHAPNGPVSKIFEWPASHGAARPAHGPLTAEDPARQAPRGARPLKTSFQNFRMPCPSAPLRTTPLPRGRPQPGLVPGLTLRTKGQVDAVRPRPARPARI
jgi:hypothetical protein